MALYGKDRNLKTSVITMLALAIFVAGFMFVMVGSNQRLFSSKYSLYMFLPNVEGLLPGAFVTLSGLKVGVVGDLRFSEKENQRGVLIELKIDKNFASKITTSSTATIKTMGILGDKYVDITLGDLNDPALEPKMFIQTTRPFDANELIARATETLLALRETLQNANIITHQILNGSGPLARLLLDENTGNDVGQIVQSLKALATQISNNKSSLYWLLQDTLLYGSFINSASNLERLLAHIQSGRGSLGKLIADTTFYTHMTSIVEQTDVVLAKLQGNGTAGKFLRDKQLYDQLLELTRSLNKLSMDFKKNPGRYVSFKLF